MGEIFNRPLLPIISNQTRTTLEKPEEEQHMKVENILKTCVISDPAKTIVQHQICGNETKMVVLLENGEQRLITFEVPKEDCTVADLLEQANIQDSQNILVSLVADYIARAGEEGINYIVNTNKKTLILQHEQLETTVTSKLSETGIIEYYLYAKQ